MKFNIDWLPKFEVVEEHTIEEDGRLYFLQGQELVYLNDNTNEAKVVRVYNDRYGDVALLISFELINGEWEEIEREDI